jgi:protein CpxP
MMTQFRKQLLISLTALGLVMGSVGAYAHKPGGGQLDGPATHAGFGERMKERMEKRQAELHGKLNLDAAQQKAWDRYIAGMKPSARPPKQDRAEMDKLPAPERMERKLAMMKVREARMAERLTAMKEFYAVLSPEQKKIFDEEFNGRRGRHHQRPHRS